MPRCLCRFFCLSLAFFTASCATPRHRTPAATPPRADPLGAAAAAGPASRPTFARVFDLYDRDGDGRITRAEYGRKDEAFRNLDRDKSGVVTSADFEIQVGMPPDLAAPFLIVMRLAGPDVESIAIGDLDEAFASADENQDGALDRAEFVGPDPARASDRFAPVLAAADSDGDRRLTLAELKGYAVKRDRDDDGRLSRRERLKPGVEPKTGWFDAAARETAPGFTLPREEGAGTVTLSSLTGKKPVALIFGSFT